MIHPLAIWFWAFAVSILQTKSIWLALLCIATIFFYVSMNSNGESQTEFNPIKVAIYFSLFAALVRVFFGVIIGVPQSGNILFSLPRLPLPDWLAGITIGGDVSSERLYLVSVEIISFTSVLLIFAFASTLTSNTQLMRIFMRRFRYIGTAMVIALSIIPQLVISVQRVRLAQRMRGIKKIGLTNWRFLAAPVIEESLERAIDLAANLENKGFGFHQNPTQFAPIKFGINERLLVISSIYLFLLSFADFSNWYLLALAILSVLISAQLIVQNNVRTQQSLIGRKF